TVWQGDEVEARVLAGDTQVRRTRGFLPRMTIRVVELKYRVAPANHCCVRHPARTFEGRSLREHDAGELCARHIALTPEHEPDQGQVIGPEYRCLLGNHLL